MKKVKILMVSFVYALAGYTQQDTVAFKSLRYDEDYSFLKNDSIQSWYSKMKHTSLDPGSKSFISFGGDIRYQYFQFKNETWGEEPKDRDGYMLSRLLAHGDIHAGKIFRGFVQLQSSLANGKHSTNLVDENPLDLHQAFVDVRIFSQPEKRLTLRVGRQELLYGSQRIISVREGPNNRQSFDGFKTMFNHSNFKADIFYTLHVANKIGIFDDGLNSDVRLWGTYLVNNNFLKGVNLDLYYFGLLKQRTQFDDGSGKELRHSVGSRLWGSVSNWAYDAEALFQFGNFANKKIKAWTASISTSYTFEEVKWQPQIGFKTEVISGDKQQDDNELNTFNPLFPRGAYFGLAALIGPSNLIDIHPTLNLNLTKKLVWFIEHDIFWRYSIRDGIYAPNVSLIYSGKNATEKFIGHQASSSVTYVPNKHIELSGEINWFKAGQFLKSVGPGKNILFGGLTVQFTF
ncbi:MAG TPA: alginate export family protein [Flavisolibacter sp.]|jgi:hypothetical protein|nr:alginate export family protein [Flavisolibacter sp.]